MSAPVDDPTCLCGDPKSEHRLGRKGCNEAAEKERVNWALIPVLEDNADRLRAELGQQSTSARLRAVEAERDEAQAQRDANMRASAEAASKLIEQRDGAAESWARARDRIAELEQLLADAGLKLVKQGNEYSAELVRLQVLLEDAQARATPAMPLRSDPPVEFHSWPAWQCLTCGNRYRFEIEHEHELTAVRVTITHR